MESKFICVIFLGLICLALGNGDGRNVRGEDLEDAKWSESLFGIRGRWHAGGTYTTGRNGHLGDGAGVGVGYHGGRGGAGYYGGGRGYYDGFGGGGRGVGYGGNVYGGGGVGYDVGLGGGYYPGLGRRGEGYVGFGAGAGAGYGYRGGLPGTVATMKNKGNANEP